MATGSKTVHTAKAYTSTMMERNMMENGLKIANMVMESKTGQTAHHTKASIYLVKSMASAASDGKKNITILLIH